MVLFIGILTILGSVGSDPDSTWFLIGMGLFGAGIGLGISQLGNTIMSAAPQKNSSEAGGLQGTANNLGMSLGTALIGAVLLTGLTTSLDGTIQSDQRISAKVKQQVTNSTKQAPVITTEDAKAELQKTSLTASEQKAVLDDYEESMINALKRSFAAAALIALIALWFVRFLPDKPLVAAKKSQRAPPKRKTRTARA
jgi:MFS family permease